jgi:hypothetical protein
MLLAPDGCYHGAGVPIERYCRHCISSCSFDRCYIKTESIASIVRTPYVEICMTLQTRYASAVAGFAKLANLIVAESACTDSLHHVEAIRVAELYLWVPECTLHMHPIVVCGALERLARNEGPPLVLLSNAILVFGLVDEFFVHALFLSVSLTLLLVCDLRLLIEFLFGHFVRTQHALVCLGVSVLSKDRSVGATHVRHALLLVVSACVTEPLVCLSYILEAVTGFVYSHTASSTFQTSAIRRSTNGAR